MTRSRVQTDTLRLSRLDIERLIIALSFSLLAHVAVWGGYEIGKKHDLWNRSHWPFLQAIPKQPPAPKIDPLVFLDVTEPVAEAPKQAKYYSDKNSRAANADADKESNQPKLDGKQTFMPKTEDTPKPVKAPPTPPTPPTPPEKTVETKPAQTLANTLMPGAFEKATPEEAANPDEKTDATPERPRTLRQAMAQNPNLLAGQQMHQEGGVRHRALRSSLDAMATPFGAYDRAIIEAVQQRWYDLLDSQKFALDRTGKVTVVFRLNPDGSVTEVKIPNDGNNVGDLLGYVCQEAIEQAAPFGKWPPDMRRMVGANFREITFTFYYY